VSLFGEMIIPDLLEGNNIVESHPTR